MHGRYDIDARTRPDLGVGWVPTSQPMELTSVRSGTFKIQNILGVPTARQFDQGQRPEVCPFTDNRKDG
jgi:hypothetical protein